MYKQKWDLDRFFSGGSHSKAFQKELKDIKHELEQLNKKLKQTPSPETILALQSLLMRLRQVESFAGCLFAQDVSDETALSLVNESNTLQASYETLTTALGNKLAELNDSEFSKLIQSPSLKDLAFALQEKRHQARDKMPLDRESLANDLSIDGYFGWTELYSTLIDSTTIPYEEKGKITQLSVGQADNKLDHPDRAVRKKVFDEMQDAWKRQKQAFSQVINHIGGFRLKLYEQRGWKSILKEPLEINRMQESTLDAMWNAIQPYKKLLAECIHRKAKLLGLKKLSWYDVEAPIGNIKKTIPYDEAAKIIIEQYSHISSDMSEFASKALKEAWIEAEDRPGKRPGGFCTGFPSSKESRIFMTYSDTVSNLSTLTHELGHAYHSHIIYDLPAFNQEYRMNVAETASTFAEQVVFDSLLTQAKDKDEKIALLDTKVQRAVIFLMNIHARFLYETRFYEQRKKGILTADQLTQLMLDAQKEAYLDALDEWNPYFWISKGHFYCVGVPFYNFPYTFGYLFSLGIYAHRNDKNFGEKYRAILEDTARMETEELARKHLNVDLTKPDFWTDALNIVAAECQEFLKLTD